MKLITGSEFGKERNFWYWETMKIQKFLAFIITPLLSFVIGVNQNIVFAQFDPGYKPNGEESVESCPLLEGDDKGLSGAVDNPGDVRQYRTYTAQSIPEMRGDAGINQARQVRGAWCGQVKSDPIQLQEDAAYNLRRLTQFCQERRWKFEQQMNYNFATKQPDANFRIPFAEEMARQWGGIWDAEHETEATIDTKERIRAGGSATAPLTSAEEAIRGQVITEIENKTGVAKMLTSLSEQDDLKRTFIDYVKTKTGKTQYENFTINGTKLTDIPYPPQDANGKTDYTSRAYADWNKQWGPTWDKLALFPNERTTGEFKFDVCDDQRYTWWYGYPEVMKMTLAANKLFQILQSKQVQDQMYTDKFTDLRNPLKSSMLIGDATSGNPIIAQTPEQGSMVSVGNQESAPAVMEGPSAVDYLKEQVQAAGDAIHDFIASFIPKVEMVFAQSLDKVVPKNPVSQRLLAQVPPGANGQTQSQATQNTYTSSAFVNPQTGRVEFVISITVPPFVEPGDILGDLIINGNKVPTGVIATGVRGLGRTVTIGSKGSGAEFTPWDSLDPLGPGSVYNIQFHNAPRYFCAGKLCSQYTPNQIIPLCKVAVLSDGSLNSNCLPDQAGPPPPNKPPEETPVVVPCRGQTCLNETKHCQLGCEICKRAQLGPSDTEMIGNPYKANHIVYGQDQGAKPVEWTWRPNPDPYTDTSECAKDGGSIKSRCGLPGCYPSCVSEAQKQCGMLNPPPDYDIQKGKGNGRTVDLYNNVPFLEATWKLVAGNYNAAETGFLHAFTINQIKGQGQLNLQGCSADENVVFDAAGNFVPLPGASWAFWSGTQMYDWTNDRPGLGETEPKVKQTVPSADEGRAKILFYRLGGLCNANKWVSGKGMLPFALQAKNNQTSAPQQTTTGFTQLNNAQTVAQKLATLDSSLPTNETPQVTTINDPTNLASQPVFSQVQSGDQIVVYSQAGKVVIYRPSTNAIVKEAPAIRIAVRNGTTNNDLFRGFLNDLAARAPNIIVSDLKEATKTDWGKTLLIDPSGAKKTDATTLAVALGIGLGDMPTDEPAPTADFLIIYGGPELVIRNGTTNGGVLTTFQTQLKTALPNATVVSTGPAAQTNVATSFLADPSGKRTTEAAAIAAAAGVRYSPSLQAETAPAGNVFLIVVGADKISNP